VRLPVQLAPFAGMAFLWSIGVLRNRLDELEDQFFATVFLGSGLLLAASLFAPAELSKRWSRPPRAVISSASSDAFFFACEVCLWAGSA
jgi:hypothetical protein